MSARQVNCIAWLALSAILTTAGMGAGDEKARPASGGRIQAFCVDFNWGPTGFAPPGMFASASSAEHVKWYRALGVNAIQTFCVSCCGYAWFRSDVAPVEPGMQGDFLKEMVALGHKDGMKVLGYFCVGSNTHWGKTNPELSHGSPSSIHIPLTDAYVDYFCASVKDALVKTDCDGFMLDWFFSAVPGGWDFSKPKIRSSGPWLACEKQLYQQLLGEPFPGEKNLQSDKELEYHRRAVERCWSRIRQTAKATKPGCILWLSCYDLDHPQVAGSQLLREIDWLMNENPNPKSLEHARKASGPQTKIIQCVCGWGDQHDADRLIRDLRSQDVGFYGFAKADEKTTLPATAGKDPVSVGNAKNIEIMRKAFRAE